MVWEHRGPKDRYFSSYSHFSITKLPTIRIFIATWGIIPSKTKLPKLPWNLPSLKKIERNMVGIFGSLLLVDMCLSRNTKTTARSIHFSFYSIKICLMIMRRNFSVGIFFFQLSKIHSRFQARMKLKKCFRSYDISKIRRSKFTSVTSWQEIRSCFRIVFS